MTTVFVSYYELGAKDYAEQVFKTLTQAGYDVYVDHIARGKKNGVIHKNIDKAIENYDIFILLNTIGSLDRDEVIREFNIAFPSHNFSKPKLFVFRDTSIEVDRGYAEIQSPDEI